MTGRANFLLTVYMAGKLFLLAAFRLHVCFGFEYKRENKINNNVKFDRLAYIKDEESDERRD